MVARTDRMGRILQEERSSLFRQSPKGFGLDWNTGVVNARDDLGARGDSGFSSGRIEVAGLRIYVGEHDFRAENGGGGRGGDKGQWRRHDLVAGLDPGSGVGEVKACGTGGHADRM